MSRYLISCIIFSVIPVFGCSVESGQIPSASAVVSPEGQNRARAEVKSTLTGLQASLGVVGRLQSLVQRGLADRSVDAGTTNDPSLSLLTPSDTDALMFDEVHPEKFEYRLNNSTTISLKTKSGGHIDIVLSGTLDDLGNHFAIRDAKLEITHDRDGNRSVFKILTETKTEQNGVPFTEWQVDFHQLSELYRAMGGQEESTLTVMNGVLTVHMSKENSTIVAKDFSIRNKNVLVAFEVVDVNVETSGQKKGNNKVLVTGHVDKDGKRMGEFSISHKSSASEADLNVAFNF